VVFERLHATHMKLNP
jgi:hypothetical protein